MAARHRQQRERNDIGGGEIQNFYIFVCNVAFKKNLIGSLWSKSVRARTSHIVAAAAAAAAVAEQAAFTGDHASKRHKSERDRDR